MINFRKTSFLTSFGFAEQLRPSTGREVVFCGRSNAGKSSLINKICGQNKLARVSSSPGKTTTINFFPSDGDITLVDLPGYGFARRSGEELEIWSKLMETYFGTQRNIALALVLLDCRHDPTEDDLDMIEYMNRFGIEYWAILTKTDKLNKAEMSVRSERFEEILRPLNCARVIPFTVKNEESAEILRTLLSECLSL
ncbi:MAG: YihA family ribosome biogenesis GTP-binding protein [Oscillospiraceae bacterium]|nr:YihA family ribosome biogenesis GTP-binding protein [Oscillospiraceae bacterium]